MDQLSIEQIGTIVVVVLLTWWGADKVISHSSPKPTVTEAPVMVPEYVLRQQRLDKWITRHGYGLV
ncbi:hypothetical protein AB6802_15190 [Mesorhizobium sp. RCC_202]|uniref:hypothetical protein n=1 Tax=Mesorhizobium sp. RCC_202 TaxID=3239222 RepID=UPI0035266E85